MITRIKSFFEENIGVKTEDTADDQALHLATAALLFEVIRADHYIDDSELSALKLLLKDQLNCPEDKLDELLLLAEQESHDATSLYQFTRLVNDHYELEQKLQLIHSMWKIAYADGNLDKYEEHIIRRVAELLYVPHREFIKSKLSAHR